MNLIVIGVGCILGVIIAYFVLFLLYQFIAGILCLIRDTVLNCCSSTSNSVRSFFHPIFNALKRLFSFFSLTWLIGFIAFGAVMYFYRLTPFNKIWQPLSASFCLILIGNGLRKKSKAAKAVGISNFWLRLHQPITAAGYASICIYFLIVMFWVYKFSQLL